MMKIDGLGKRLKDGRLRAGLSQSQAGALIGKESQTISIYENDKGFPSLVAFYKMAARYKVSTDWLLGLDTEKKILVKRLPEEEIALLQQIADKLDKPDKRKNKGLLHNSYIAQRNYEVGPYLH